MKRPGELADAVFQPQRRRRTPEAEKRLSYERDCVNQYYENDKGSRKAIPRFKAESNRKKRRMAKQVLPLVEDGQLPESADKILADSDRKLPRNEKGRDVPLGIILAARDSEPGQTRNRPMTRNRRASVVAELAATFRDTDDMPSKKRRERKAKK